VIGAAAVAPIAHAPVDWFAVAPEIALFGAAVAIVIVRSSYGTTRASRRRRC